MKKLIELFLTFFKIGLFTFGGGYAMLSLIDNEIVEKKKWLTADELSDIVAVAESTPGPIAINSATYIGYKQKGFLGSLFATVAVVLPSLIIIYVISLFLESFLQITLIAKAFNGIKCAVALLIASAAVKLFKNMKKNAINFILAAAAFAISLCTDIFAWNFSSIYLILSGALIGMVFYGIIGARDAKQKTTAAPPAPDGKASDMPNPDTNKSNASGGHADASGREDVCERAHGKEKEDEKGNGAR